MRGWIALIFVLIGTAAAFGQPAGVTRVLRQIDFEERRLGNPEETPMHWAKVQAPDMPHYVNGRLSTDRARSGRYSFKFELNGGSVAYRYEPGRIRVQAGAHYRVECWVQTTVMAHARARLTAYLLDLDGHAIEESVRHSEPYAAKAENEGWTLMGVELSADAKEADSLVFEVELLQPARYAATTLGKQAIFPQDIRGCAWFDDVSVAQVPKVKITAERPGNVFKRGEQVSLQVLVNDRFTDDLAAQLVVRDALGKVAYQRSGALDMSKAEQLEGGQKRMRVALPELPAGWYEAALVMTSQGALLGQQTLALVVLAETTSFAAPDERFGVIATDLPFDGWSELPELLPVLGAGRVKLGVWSRGGDILKMDSAGFDQLLVRLQELHITPTACFVEPPADVAARMGGGWLQLRTAPREAWQPQLAFLVARHANHLDRWQLGADGSDAFVTQPGMREVYDIVYREFANLVQKPDLAMPWPAWYELDGKMPATVALSVPPSVLPNQLPLYMQDIRRHEGQNLSLSLELLDRKQYGRELQIRDLAQRVIYALSADARRIDLPLPFTVQRQGDVVMKQPQELLLVMRTLMTTLAGAVYRGKVPMADGVEAFLFERNGQGIMALWDRGSEGGNRQLTLHLGQRPAVMDLWGNVTPLLKPASKDNLVQLAVGPMPMFLIDIDASLAQLRASIGFDRPLIESSFQQHTRRLRFINPYRQAIGGTIKLKAPAGWTLNPPTITFTLNPGEKFDREVTIEFPYNSFAGPKTIMAELALQADRNVELSVPITLTLGLSDVGMQSLALRDGKDVVVQQIITNYGDKPIDYTAFSIYPGQARQERLVTSLGAGHSTIKRYRFTNVSSTTKSRVRVGVKELDGTRILNDEIEIQ